MKKLLLAFLLVPILCFAQSNGNVRTSIYGNGIWNTGTWTGTGVPFVGSSTSGTVRPVSGTGVLVAGGGTAATLTVTGSDNTIQTPSVNTSTDAGASYYPTFQSIFTGYTPTGRLQYHWSASSSDNPTRAHSVQAMSVNRSFPGPTSDDGTSTFAQWHIENNYWGPSLATVTSATTTAGVTTFTVNSTASLLVGKGIWVNGNSITGLNAGWQIATIPNGTTFTAATSASFNGQNGTGGNIYAPGSEIVGTLNTHRLIFGFAATTNADQDNGLQFYAPIQIETPVNSVNGPTVQIACTESTTSNNAGGEMRFINRDATSANFALRFANLLNGGRDLYINYDPNKNGSGNFQITHANVNVLAGVAVGNRILYGGPLSGDNGSDKHQFFGGNVWFSGSTSLIYEGSTADAFETTVSVVDPTADRTINWPNQSGTAEVSAITVTSGTQTLDATSPQYQVYTGGALTQNLPTVTARGAIPFFYKNAGSGNLTIAAPAATVIYDTGTTSSVIIAPGEARIFVGSGTTYYMQ